MDRVGERPAEGLPEDAIDTQEAAGLLRSSRSLIYRMVADGRLDGWAIGGTRVMVSRAQVLAQVSKVTPKNPDGPRSQGQEQAAARAALGRLARKGYDVGS
jgi:excisionase family DNA binding protein